MKSKDLKSLCETIATTVEATQPKQLAEGYINSLTEKARQVYSSINEEKDEDEDEKEESPAEEKAEDKAEMLMKKLAAKALKRAKKKAATNEEVELAEKAAPGYENWASDPKVKASFKKQYGKRWKQVMYAKSWKMSKMDEEIELAEGVKRMRRLRRAHVSGKGSRETADAYDKELSKLSASRLRRGGAPKQTIRGFFTDKPTTAAANKAYTEFAKRAMQKASAKGKKVFESEQLDEAGYKRLGRIKGAAYKAELASRGADPNTSMNALMKTSKLKRAAAEREAQVAAGMARRGGASPDAVRGGGSRIGKSGKYTQKAGALANQRDKALGKFRGMASGSKSREAVPGGFGMYNKNATTKRKMQQARAAFEKKARIGDIDISPSAKMHQMFARLNFQKRFGRLKGK